MEKSTNYYYMRLKENFFESEDIVLLESMQDGYLYSNILLKMYVKSLKSNGRLDINGIPYNPQMIATVTRHQVGTVEKALKIFQEWGFIIITEDNRISMTDIRNGRIKIGENNYERD